MCHPRLSPCRFFPPEFVKTLVGTLLFSAPPELAFAPHPVFPPGSFHPRWLCSPRRWPLFGVPGRGESTLLGSFSSTFPFPSPEPRFFSNSDLPREDCILTGVSCGRVFSWTDQSFSGFIINARMPSSEDFGGVRYTSFPTPAPPPGTRCSLLQDGGLSQVLGAGGPSTDFNDGHTLICVSEPISSSRDCCRPLCAPLPPSSPSRVPDVFSFGGGGLLFLLLPSPCSMGPFSSFLLFVSHVYL